MPDKFSRKTHKSQIEPSLAKRLECVKLASALELLRKRKQASRTPNASRGMTCAQNRSPNHPGAPWQMVRLIFVIWSFPGVWSLEFGVSNNAPRNCHRPRHLERYHSFTHRRSLADRKSVHTRAFSAWLRDSCWHEQRAEPGGLRRFGRRRWPDDRVRRRPGSGGPVRRTHAGGRD